MLQKNKHTDSLRNARGLATQQNPTMPQPDPLLPGNPLEKTLSNDYKSMVPGSAKALPEVSRTSSLRLGSVIAVPEAT